MEHNQYITWRRTCQGYTAERTKKEIRHKQHISFCLRLCPNAQKRAHGLEQKLSIATRRRTLRTSPPKRNRDKTPQDQAHQRLRLKAYFAYVPTQAKTEIKLSETRRKMPEALMAYT